MMEPQPKLRIDIVRMCRDQHSPTPEPYRMNFATNRIMEKKWGVSFLFQFELGNLRLPSNSLNYYYYYLFILYIDMYSRQTEYVRRRKIPWNVTVELVKFLVPFH